MTLKGATVDFFLEYVIEIYQGYKWEAQGRAKWSEALGSGIGSDGAHHKGHSSIWFIGDMLKFINLKLFVLGPLGAALWAFEI